jgi:mxaA protein
MAADTAAPLSFPALASALASRLGACAAGALLLCLPAQGAAAATEPAPRVEISPSRDYGYTMGDLVRQTIRVAVPEAYTLESGFLPKPGALDEWLEVRSVNWDREPGQGAAVYRIGMVYQVFKGVRGPEKATVPELTLRFSGPVPLEVKTPSWDFTVTPLIPPDLADAAVTIREATPPEPEATAPHRRRLALYLAGALAGAGWLAWQRLGPTRRARPFARARREVKRLLRSSESPENFRAAAKLIHRALDETFGGTLFAGQLDRFCAARPAFAVCRDELDGFFALSQRLFFTSPEAAVTADYPAARLVELCRRCAAAERRAG